MYEMFNSFKIFSISSYFCLDFSVQDSYQAAITDIINFQLWLTKLVRFPKEPSINK